MSGQAVKDRSLPAPVLAVATEYCIQYDDGSFYTNDDGTPNVSKSIDGARQKVAGQEYLMSLGIRPRLTGARVIARVTTTATAWEEATFE